MIHILTVNYEEYWCDFIRKDHTKTFLNLESLENWIFEQMKQDYRKNNSAMYLPCGDEMSSINFKPAYDGPNNWIHLIKSTTGIIFSDGRYTSGQKFGSRRVRDWLKHCKERRDNPTFNFIE